MNDYDDELLTIADVSRILRIGVATLRQWRFHEFGPKGFRLGGSLRYRRSTVEAWIQECENAGTMEREAWTP